MIGQWLLIALVLVSLKGSNFVSRFLSLFCCIVTVPFAVVSLLPQKHPLSTNVVIAIWVSRSPHMGDCVGIRRHQSREQIAAAAWMIAGSPATLQRCPHA